MQCMPAVISGYNSSEKCILLLISYLKNSFKTNISTDNESMDLQYNHQSLHFLSSVLLLSVSDHLNYFFLDSNQIEYIIPKKKKKRERERKSEILKMTFGQSVFNTLMQNC